MPSHKEFYDALNNISVNADTLNLNTDQVESKLDTTTGLLTTLSADTAIIKNDMANGVLSDLRDGSGNAITSTVSGAKRSLDVTASVSFPSSLDTNTRDGSGNAITSTTQGSTRRLDVMLSSGGATGSSVPANANLIGGTDGTNLRGLSVDSSGRINTNINGTVPVSGTVTANNQSLTTGTGTLSGASAVGTDLIASTDVSGFAEASVQFTGAWPASATVTPQLSNDNSTWFSTTVLTISTTTPTLTNTFTSTQFTSLCRVGLFGGRYFRLRVTSAASSGTYDFAYSFNPRSTSLNAQPVNIIASTALTINPSTGNGFSTYHTAISAASTNATNVKASVPSIGSMIISNTSASIRYFKIFNLTVAPTMGTSTPVLNYAIMPNSTMAIDCSFAGLRLSSGLSYAITAGQALLDNTSVGAGDVVVNLAYA
jgi:hypothetical protein